MSYILGGVFAFSLTQELKSSSHEEEPKPNQGGRRDKLPTGYRAPHPSLAITDIAEGSDFQQKLKALAKEHWYKSGIRAILVDVDKKPESTLGVQYKSNFGVYSLFENGKLIEGLEVRMAFSALKELDK